MRGVDWVRLLVLSAVWGASFIFMRVLAPILGPIVTADLRVAIGAAALLLYFALIRFRPKWRAHWRAYAVIGTFNVGLPFLLFSYAALHIPAAYSAILNATTPLFGTAFAVLWLGDTMSRAKGFGLVLGVVGVATITGASAPTAATLAFNSAIAACLLAAASYAGAGIYIKRCASHVHPLESAGCAQLFAAVALLPFWITAAPPAVIDLNVALNVLGLGVLSSGLGFVLYFRLVNDIGPARAMMVAFLAPLFGIVWGIVFLGETLTPAVLLGGALIIASTVLILRRPRQRQSPTACATTD